MNFDNEVQKIAKSIGNLYFRSFDGFVDEPQAKSFGWYYSESELYILINYDIGGYFFVRSTSPRLAYDKLKERLKK